jgi:peptidyl-tRNA hydrolase
VGISPTTPSGKIKKPKGEDAVTKVIMGNFKDNEMKELKKLSKKLSESLETFVSEGLEKAMTGFN